MRKPISITTTLGHDGDYLTNVIADDGTIWELVDTDEGWKRLPDLPQDDDFEDVLPQPKMVVKQLSPESVLLDVLSAFKR